MSGKSIAVTFGEQQRIVDTRLASGEYDTASEVVQAALRALDREKDLLDDIMRSKLREAVDDPRPSIPAARVFEKLRAFHEAQVKADERDI